MRAASSSRPISSTPGFRTARPISRASPAGWGPRWDRGHATARSTRRLVAGQTFHDWLQNVGGLSNNTIALTGVAQSVAAVSATTTRWIYDSTTSDTKYLSFETPIGGVPSGRRRRRSRPGSIAERRPSPICTRADRPSGDVPGELQAGRPQPAGEGARVSLLRPGVLRGEPPGPHQGRSARPHLAARPLNPRPIRYSGRAAKGPLTGNRPDGGSQFAEKKKGLSAQSRSPRSAFKAK